MANESILNPSPLGDSQPVQPSISTPVHPDPEVIAHPQRRHFSAAYKLSILKKAEACRGPGELGALLRREGLYRSHVRDWRYQYEAGALKALQGQKRGPKENPAHPLEHRVAELERENERLQQKLQQAETIIDVQKKISQLLGIPLTTPHQEAKS